MGAWVILCIRYCYSKTWFKKWDTCSWYQNLWSCCLFRILYYAKIKKSQGHAFWGWQSYYHAAVIKRWRDRKVKMWANQTLLPLQVSMNTAFQQTHVVLPYCIISRISIAAFALALKHFLLVDYEKEGNYFNQNDRRLLKQWDCRSQQWRISLD